jgi:hypothetical protein
MTVKMFSPMIFIPTGMYCIIRTNKSIYSTTYFHKDTPPGFPYYHKDRIPTAFLRKKRISPRKEGSGKEKRLDFLAGIY